MSEFMKICDNCTQFCLFILSKIPRTTQVAKCDICKKKQLCSTYKVVTKGEKND